MSLNFGLSLCIQGTFICAQPQPPNRRFIPVYTGNMLIINVSHNDPSGLSLCIQGTLRCGSIPHILKRFIPVYTGNI